MNWIKTGIFSLIGGLAIGFGTAFVLSATGDCAIGALAKTIGFGVPIGNTVGIGVYRMYLLKVFTKADRAAVILSLVFSEIAAFAGLHAMDIMGSLPGFFVALLGSCLGSLLGYALGLRIVGRYGQRHA